MSSRIVCLRKYRKHHSNYSTHDLKNAIKLIVREECSIRRAARVFNIPRTTLTSYLNDTTIVSPRPRKGIMQPQEEAQLMQWMTECCQQGFSIKKRIIEAAADQIIKQSGEARRHPFADASYYDAFLKRWLSVDTERDRKFIGVVPDWHSHIECYLVEKGHYDILNYSNRIFLCDEFKFKERMDISQAIKSALVETNMLYTTTAGGDVLQPLIVYPYKGEIPDSIVKAAPKNCAIVPQQHGTVTTKIFIAYLKKVLHKFIELNRIPTPVIVYVDESLIDLNLELTATCKSLGIVLLGLTCQVLKPTINLFRNLVIGWTLEVQKWCQTNKQGFSINECARIMQAVNQKYIRRDEICKDFSDCMMFPWSRPATSSVSMDAADYQDEEAELERFLEGVDDDEDDDACDYYMEDEEVPEVTQEEDAPEPVNVQEPAIAKDCTISLSYGDFEGQLGSELMQKYEQNYDSGAVAFPNRAERVLYDIYRRFRTASGGSLATRKNAVIEVVEIIDD